ncbi:bifunctional 4-hydroxy-2-oxoglutarate aldolase/2-dehydro-3-deoxy-phosphogluconate aldolase [Nigerium massiliense]|uniref:bifunctional 4-hydroxy-2-oxoglutarate aldolase/2-dehydro-3-deoxy-phosphogluconate aldolase n=1 Tax=Nigerium massiliense TaxID=1522317 RepID=UPI000693EC4A|nr:bifunctional 4-hydroxy-2-oxoglutarate aldolase/2-dehydro-3-deoxy-phosphogluconate aldolase [Nigerium massiliense]
MAAITDALGGEHLFAEVPVGGVADWVPLYEVMIQERLSAWALPVDRLDDLPVALGLFGRRARIGVHGVRFPHEVSAAFDAGAAFVTSPVCSPELVAAAAGRPFVAGGLTPQEVGGAVAQGATAAQVIPADVMGMSYSRALMAMLPDVPIVATGRLERFQAEMWLQAGAVAVGLSQTILLPEDDGAVNPNDPDEVRRRCQTVANLATG